MGAWWPGAFQNDDAMDFVADLMDAPPPQRAERIHSALSLDGAYIDVLEACEALAAAALVAAAWGMPLLDPPGLDEISHSSWVPPTDGDRARAKEALLRIMGNGSEWRELWEEGDLFQEARQVCEDIRMYL